MESEKLALSDFDLTYETIDRADLVLDEARGNYLNKVRYLPPPWRFVYTLQVLNQQVMNGGFHQFFTNTRGLFDRHLAEDVARLENDEYRSIIEKAWTIYQAHDYRVQWKNIGRSWELFTAPYSEGRFDAEDAFYFSLKPCLEEVIGSQIRAHFSEYQ